MPGRQLTRAEAEERAAVVADLEVDVALDLTAGPEVFGSTTTLRFRSTPGAATFLDAIAVEVESVRLNGRELELAEVVSDERILLPGLAEVNEVTVVATMRYSTTGEGLHRFVDPADDRVYLYTQLAVDDARRVLAIFDQPDLKARFALEATAPAGWTLIGNQPVRQTDAVGDGDTWWRFEPTPPISSYLLALMAGPYVVQSGELTSADGRTIPLGVVARASLAPHVDAEDLLETTRAGFGFYEDAFGIPFPFDKYDQVFVPEYNWGAMENPGAVTFNEAYVFRSTPTDAQRERRATTVLHELAHMWFGDLVTMRWWDDLWLNESFATFMSALAAAEATRWTDAWATFVITEKTWGYEQDQLPSTHPIVARIDAVQDVQTNFDGITYAKGASVLKQLVAFVGRREFFAGVSAYLTAHAWSNATLTDLLAAVAAASGRDLSAWSAAWLQTSGVNTLVPEVETDADGAVTRFAVRQEPAPVGDPELRPHRLAIGLYEPEEEDGELVRVDRADVEVAGERTELPALVDGERPAILLLNDDDWAYAKVRLDPRSLATAQERLSRVPAALARTLLWSTVWDMTRDAEARASDWLQLVLDHIGAEASSPLRAALLAQAQLAGDQYVAPAVRGDVLAAYADGLLRLLAEAETGSDAQLQLARAFAAAARTPDQLEAVADLDGGAAEGLPLDPELRWAFLTALVAGGRAGEARIAAMLETDRTAKGRESAILARAAIPTAEAKAAAWASVVDRDDLTNEQVRSTLRGLRRALDPALLAPYATRYTDVLDGLWASRSTVIAEELAEGLYPAPLADASLAGAAEGWLAAHPEAPSPLVRIVRENLARTRRALAAQSRDGS